MNFVVRNARDFHDRRKRHGEQAATHAEEQRLNAGEGERGAKLECGALALFRGNLNGSLEAIEDGSNDVHTDPAARHFGDFGGSAQASFKNKIESVLLGEALGFFGFQKFGLDGACAEPGKIDAATIVAYFNDDLSALMIGVEIDGAAGGLSGSQSFVGRLNAMIDGIAHDMHERLGESIEDAFVEVRVLTGDLESHVFAALFGDVANDARKTAEELFDGHHANLQNAFVQFVEDARLKCHGVGKLGTQRIAGMLLIELRESAIEHGLADDQFTDEIHHGVNTRCLHAESGFGNSGRR